MYYGVTCAKKAYLPLAIALHMLMDTFPGLYQRSIVPLWSIEVWAAVVIFLAMKLYRKMKLSSADSIR